MTLTTYASRGRDNNFHLIRHLAAIAVILTHSYSIVTGEYASEPLVGWFGTSIGHYAVDVFFVLSGFLIAQSLARDPDPVRFAASRVLRIFPALAVAVLGVALVLGPLVSTFVPADYFADPRLPAYISGALTTTVTSNPLPGVFETNPEAGVVNMPLWTLKYEIAAYASVGTIATLALFLGRRMLAAVAVAVLVGFVASRMAFPAAGTESVIGNATKLLFAFYLGAGFYVLRRHVALAPSGVVALLFLTVAFGPTIAGELAEHLLVAYGVLWLAFLPAFAPATRALERFGDCSYGLYIFAYPVQQTLRAFIPDIEPLTLFVATLAITLPLAYTSWHLLERPSLAARDRIVGALKSIGLRLKGALGR